MTGTCRTRRRLRVACRPPPSPAISALSRAVVRRIIGRLLRAATLVAFTPAERMPSTATIADHHRDDTERHQ